MQHFFKLHGLSEERRRSLESALNSYCRAAGSVSSLPKPLIQFLNLKKRRKKDRSGSLGGGAADVLAELHVRQRRGAKAFAARVASAYTLTAKPPPVHPLVLDVIRR